MLRRCVLCLCAAGLCLCTATCQKLESVRPLAFTRGGQLPIEPTKFFDAVPAEYGDLISVTAVTDDPSWVQAWFMKPDKSLVVVWINGQTGKMLQHVLMIPRR